MAVTRALLAATAVQHPDLHLDVTVTPVTMVMVVMVVMMVMVMAASLLMLVMMMIMDLRSGLLPHRGHVSSAILASNNHPRPRVNPLHSEKKSLETVAMNLDQSLSFTWLILNPVSRSPSWNPVSPSWIASPVSYPSKPRLDYDYDSLHVFGIAL